MSLKDLWHKLTGPVLGPLSEEPESSLAVEQITLLEAKLGHTFQEPDRLRQALLHRSHQLVTGQNPDQAREQSNERLEFLGDAVLGLVVNDFLYRAYPETSEGDLTKMKSMLVCRDRLAEVATRLELGEHVRMSRSEAATGGRQRASILADAVEAVIGAVYLDGGLSAAQRVIKRCLLADYAASLASRQDDNYKSRLQEIIQARFKSPPRYRVVGVHGPDHARVFQVSVTFNGHLLGQGEGANKKTAEQEAARQALASLDAHDDLLQELADPPRD
jgi:ribonuclease III